MPRAARTGTLKRLTGENFRLSAADRAFLSDLVKVRVIAVDDADEHHYQDQKSGARRRLDKLVDAGLLKAHDFTVPGSGAQRAYSFSSQTIAGRFGGKLPNISRMRNAFHEVLTSRVYFAEGRPDSFKLEADLTLTDKSAIRQPGQSLSDVHMPDAVYRDAQGNLVMVEADSGQYNQRQIRQKINAWSAFRQVWAQPMARNSAVENQSNATVHRF